MEKTVRTERKASDYTSYTQHELVLNRPSIFIGSMDKYMREEIIFDFETDKFIPKIIDIPDSMIRLFLEAVSNAGDNIESSRNMKVDPGVIEVLMNNKIITVKSGGEPIPIVIKEDLSTKDEYFTIPDFIFGVLNSSSNYDESINRVGSGINGLGIKLNSIYSSKFHVKVGDSKNGIEYEGKWENNMFDKILSKTNPPFIYNSKKEKWELGKGKKYDGPSYVEVSWELDFPRFGYTEYPEDAFNLFAKLLIDYSLTCKVPVFFNNVKYDNRSIREYARLLFKEDEVDTSLIHFEWEGEKIPAEFKKFTEIRELEDAVASANKKGAIPILEVCILDTPDEARYYSFVNGMITKDGGVHVDSIINAVSKDILEIFNSSSINSPKKGKKKEEEKEKTKSLITIKDIKQHISIVLNCRLKDPTFTSQSKTHLTSPKPAFSFNKKEFEICEEWQIMYRLTQEMNFKKQKLDDKSINKGKGRLKNLKGEEANFAGGPRSKECILYLTEGDSAAGYAKTRISLLPGGKDIGGYYPLKGKVLNVTNSPLEQAEKNKEVNAIFQLIGLREGVDYSLQENLDTLRYHFVLSTVDADSDGKHINLLLINLFNEKFPFILENNMFGYLLTPAIKIVDKKGKILYRFYSEDEFNTWSKNNKDKLKSVDINYYKGLATSEMPDIKDDITTASTIICFYDSCAKNSLELAFDKGFANQRKKWIEMWRDKTKVNDIITVDISKMLKQRNITDIINTDLVEYSVDTLFRTIPNYKDGLKKSQRQALYFILNKWNYGHSTDKPVEVERITGGATEKLHYHHGSKSLQDTIIKMAQTFPGSNNLNLFYQGGDFGTRHMNGKDAGAARYIKTKPEWWIKYAFDKDVVELVEKRKVEDDEVEPYWLPCIIPLHIINGGLGIGTGFSTFIPCANPFDVIKWIINKCKGESKIIKIVPWYNEFNGKTEVKILKKNENISGEKINVISEEDAENYNEEDEISGKSLKTYGKFEILKTYPDDSADILVSELPIGRATHDYHNWLKQNEGNKLKKDDDEGITLKSFSDNSTPDGKTILFRINKFKSSTGKIDFKTLKLIKSFGLNNMVLIDDKGFPTKFSNVDDILDIYYINMIKVFKMLIEKRIADCLEKIEMNKVLYKFIQLCLDKKIIYEKKKKDEIYKQMDKFDIPREYLTKVKIYDLTLEELEKLIEKIKELEDELVEIKKTSPEGIWIEKLVSFEKELKKRGYGKN